MVCETELKRKRLVLVQQTGGRVRLRERLDVNKPSKYVFSLKLARCWKCGGPVEDTGLRLGFNGIIHAVVKCVDKDCSEKTHWRIK